MSTPDAHGRSSHGAPRLLIIDDDPRLHDDYRRCLGPPTTQGEGLRARREALFGPEPSALGVTDVRFELVHALSGASGLTHLRESVAADDPFSVAFVDMRMPPGWNGVETIRELWSTDPDLQMVVCTAYSDFTWDAVIAGVGRSEGLHLLRKPFGGDQVRRFAEVLTKKWQLARAAERGVARAGSR